MMERTLTGVHPLFNHCLIVEGSLSKQLANIVLPDTDDREIRLGSLWESKPAVIVFLRHYG